MNTHIRSFHPTQNIRMVPIVRGEFREVVEENSPLIPLEKAEYFHRTTARFLYAGKRARPDIQVTVAFLCKRVREPNESD